jgi:hypothetical protein
MTGEIDDRLARASNGPRNVATMDGSAAGDSGDRDDQTSIPELVGVAEIARILGVSAQRAASVVKSAQFPAPVARLAAGDIWTRPSLDGFIEMWSSQPADAHRAATVIVPARYRLEDGEWRSAARLELIWDDTGEHRRADSIRLQYAADLGGHGVGPGVPVDLLFAGERDTDPILWAKVSVVRDDVQDHLAELKVIAGPLQP